ncbi:hypothetical protein Zmor_009645 [Zophobas morio]|uniref:Uncharacterized protein n=1 Tax=Zophobas morio TaxID=2755281 RepID=A0AA38IR11_9CUCU|nr:hypothetical protein Zmor_009645 [Zophobas morio]
MDYTGAAGTGDGDGVVCGDRRRREGHYYEGTAEIILITCELLAGRWKKGRAFVKSELRKRLVATASDGILTKTEFWPLSMKESLGASEELADNCSELALRARARIAVLELFS